MPSKNPSEPETIEMLLNTQRLSELESRLMDGHLALMAKNYAKAEELIFSVNPDHLTPELLAIYYTDLGEAYLFLDKSVAAREVLEKGLNLYYTQYALSILGRERIRNMIGITYYKEGKYATAQDYFLKCLDAHIRGTVDDRRFKVNIYRNLGNCYLALKAVDNALDSYNLALHNTLEEEEEETRAALYWGMADIYYQHYKNFKDGVSYYYRSAEMFRRAGNYVQASRVRSSLGAVLLEREQIDEAIEVLKSALEDAWKTGNLGSVTYANIQLSRAYSLKQDNEKAIQYGHFAVDFANQQSTPLVKGQATMTLAQAVILNDAERGLALFEEAGTYLHQTDHKEILKLYLKEYSDALKSQGQIQKAFDLLTAAFKA